MKRVGTFILFLALWFHGVEQCASLGVCVFELPTYPWATLSAGDVDQATAAQLRQLGEQPTGATIEGELLHGASMQHRDE